MNLIHGILRAGLKGSEIPCTDALCGKDQPLPGGSKKRPPLKVGHTGTLDPLASGVLLIAVGPATRLVEFSHQCRKAYSGEFRFGFTSDTLDIDGEVQKVELSGSIDQMALETELTNWMGEIEQIPPKYSAVHIDGRRAYELARKGAEFTMPSRRVTIHGLQLQDFNLPDWSIEMECSTGTYVRTLGDDIAQSLGTRAIMTKLERTSLGAINVTDCLPLRKDLTFEDLRNAMLPPNVLLETLPAVTLSKEAAQRIRNGIPLEAEAVMESVDEWDEQRHANSQYLAAVDELGCLVGVLQPAAKKSGSQAKGLYRSVRVFQADVAQSAPTASQPSSMNKPQSPES